MEKFSRLTAIACPLDLANIDTDQVLPARFLKMTRASGLGRVLFHDLRFDAQAQERPDFPLNRPPWRDARILFAGRNFAGGSSREAAVYALLDYGIRCVIAPSFGDIFAQNAVMNGLLPGAAAPQDIEAVVRVLKADPARHVTVDLDDQSFSCADMRYPFVIDAVRRQKLLNGWDDIDLTRQYRARIDAFVQSDVDSRPWARPWQKAGRS